LASAGQGKHLTVKGFFLGDFDHVSKVLPAQIEAAPLVAPDALRLPVAAVYPMSKIKEAVTHLLKGGKTLIDIAGTVENRVWHSSKAVFQEPG
jgi:NADPH:quinone reductase-like Zn-dependent oxidoreductase